MKLPKGGRAPFAAKAASDVVKSVSDVATPILATSTGAVASTASERIVIAEAPNAGQHSESRQRGRPW
jgi:hypothetical protein